MQPTTLDPLSAESGLAFNSARPKSAASWGAIFAGALVAIAVSLLLLALGTGLGFASISPWADRGVSATAFTISAAIWLIVMQWVSSLFGGYIAGRLRTRWIGTHVHEIFFRDTAHGFVTWALATVVVATIVASALSAGIGGGAKAVSGVAAAGAFGASQGAAQGGMSGPGGMGGASSPLSYSIDKLFRPTPKAAGGPAMMAMSGPGAGTNGQTGGAAGQMGAMAGPTGSAGPMGGPGIGGPGTSDPRVEATRIMVNALTTGGVPDADRTYLVSLVAGRTGMSNADAQKRVDEFIASANELQAKAKAEADAARKDAAEVGIYTALSMLIGAFIASIAAVLGGRLRDEHI